MEPNERDYVWGQMFLCGLDDLQARVKREKDDQTTVTEEEYKPESWASDQALSVTYPDWMAK